MRVVVRRGGAGVADAVEEGEEGVHVYSAGAGLGFCELDVVFDCWVLDLGGMEGGGRNLPSYCVAMVAVGFWFV